jgi:hypothetical protein
MTEGIFPDRDRPPARESLVAGLGERIVLWDRLAGWIEATYGVEPEPLFYGRDTGWVVRYRRSGKSLTVLIPGLGAVEAVVVIGPSIADRIGELDLQPGTRTLFEEARAYPDGRWLTIELGSDADVDDVRALISLKSPPPRRLVRRKQDASPTAGRS